MYAIRSYYERDQCAADEQPGEGGRAEDESRRVHQLGGPLVVGSGLLPQTDSTTDRQAELHRHPQAREAREYGHVQIRGTADVVGDVGPHAAKDGE